MADDSTVVNPQTLDGGEAGSGAGEERQGQREGGRGRGQAPRDAGGFRIRLSDNELRAARALQDAFGLRSTVAVLGFSLRTLAQQLEDGQLESLIAEQRAQRGPGAGRSGERERPGERRRERGERGEGRPGAAAVSRGPRIDPFARPARPAPSAPVDAATGEPSGEPTDEPAVEPTDAPIDALGDHAALGDDASAAPAEAPVDAIAEPAADEA